MQQTKSLTIFMEGKHVRHVTEPSLFLLPVFLVLLSNPFPAHALTLNRSVDIRQADVLAVFISPPMEGLSVVCHPLEKGQLFKLYMAVNETDQSVIQVLLQSPGYYNITLTLQSKGEWSFSIGVLTTKNPEWYSSPNVKRVGNAYFVEFLSGSDPSKGNQALNILANVHAAEVEGGSWFIFQLPTSINAVIFVLAAVFASYLNTFFLTDTYFKDKKEGVSRKRWIGCGLLILVSVFVIYQVYVLTALTPIWS